MTDQKTWKPAFKEEQEVFFTAFLAEDKNTFYVCKGSVEGIPGPNQRQVYKVKITAVSDRPVGGQPVVRQARLLGLIVSKRTRELIKDLSPFMQPKNWIDKVPKDLQYKGKKNVSGKQSNRQTPRVPSQHGRGAGASSRTTNEISRRNQGDSSGKPKTKGSQTETPTVPTGGYSNSPTKKT